MDRKEFWTLVVTMIIGGLSYSIISFSYMHEKFSTQGNVINLGLRLNRIDSRLDKRLSNIEDKIDRLIERHTK